MSQIYLHKGQRDRGLEYARNAVESEPENGVYWHALGRVYHEMSGPEMLPAAMRCYGVAIRRRPHDGATWFDLGRAEAAARRWENAVAAFRRARQADPGNGEIHYHLGQALQQLGQRDEANRELVFYRIYSDYLRQQRPIQKALQRRPDDPGLKLQLAELCLAFRQYAPARQAAQEALAAAGRGGAQRAAAIRDRARRLLARAEAALVRRQPAARPHEPRADRMDRSGSVPAGPPPGSVGRR
jgi:tetratricopeptide (TPR) repeat protein